jgi:cytochrome b6
MAGHPEGRPTPAPSRGLHGWLDARYQLEGLRGFLAEKSVPVTRHFFLYYFGGVALFLFIIQVLTGILLLLYYRAGSDASFESVRFIVSQVKFGWLVRSIHSWSANLMALSAFLHMFSVYFTRAYRPPRELSWVTGFLLLVLVMGFGFSGYLLPWNELAFFATKVGTDIVGVLPFIGHPLLVLLRGGDEVTGATLSRFFGIHVAVLPGLFTVVLALHLLMIQRQGMAEPVEWERTPGRRMPFFPHFMLRDLLLWVVVLNILAVLAVLFPWGLGQKADAFASAPAGIRPEWYFLFMFQTLKLLPARIAGIEGELLGVLGFGAAGLAWLLVPFFDRGADSGRGRSAMRLIGVAVVVYMIVFTVLGWVLA